LSEEYLLALNVENFQEEKKIHRKLFSSEVSVIDFFFYCDSVVSFPDETRFVNQTYVAGFGRSNTAETAEKPGSF